jgi:hypothetical protein
VSTAEKIFEKAQALPGQVQDALLRMAEELARKFPSQSTASEPMTLHESAELRGKLAAWEEDWNAPGMEAYDRSQPYFLIGASSSAVALKLWRDRRRLLRIRIDKRLAVAQKTRHH